MVAQHFGSQLHPNILQSMVDLLAVVGPTASGKTRRAVELARAFNGEIISGDSRQVYTGMDIGTGKDLEEYGEVAVHLVDMRPAGYRCNLHEYITEFHHAVRDIRSRGHLPILCGGSGLYVETALAGVQLPNVPKNEALRAQLEGKSLEELSAILASYRNLHNTTDTDNPRRAIRAIEIEEYYATHPQQAALADKAKAERPASLIIGVDIPRDDRRRRIEERLDARLRAGMVEEITRLLDSGIPASDLIYYGLEYKFVTLYATGELSFREMREGLLTAIRQFAKRQMTWFRGMERRGFPIHWLAYDMPSPNFTAAVASMLR